MSDMLSQLVRLLEDAVLPSLNGIQASQAAQRQQTEQLNRTLDEFRAEMRLRFTEMRVELAACQAQVEDAMMTLREAETVEVDDSSAHEKKTLIH